MRHTVELFGVPTDALTMDETVDAVRDLVRTGTPHQHVVLNAAKVVAMDRDAHLREVVAHCDLINADGASVVWASHALGRPLPERVAGIDLFLRLVEAAHDDGDSVYFLGASQDVVDRTVTVLEERHPGLRVAGSHNGFWSDDREVIEAVRHAHPDYLFLAIPSPRKEFWLNEHLQELGVPFVMGVGGSFDVVAGAVSRAPVWMQRAGLEWAWRLGQEPRRMWKRYLVGNTAFIRLTLRERRRLHAS
jgi:N-acetylglucosaminyldiphosphoundecaprenol N-acetyl-beta-D-mannosaminyltransferase